MIFKGIKVIKRGVLWLSLLYLAAIGFGTWGYTVHKWQIFPYRLIHRIEVELTTAYQELKRRPLTEMMVLHNQVQKNHFAYGGFVRRDQSFEDPGFLLISRFSRQHGQVIVELLRLHPFERIHTWIPPIKEIIALSKRDKKIPSLPMTEDGFRVQHPLLLDDGSIIFGHGEGCLARVDHANHVLWVNGHHFHHSIEKGCDGHLIVCINIHDSPIIQNPEWRDDGYAVISTDGKLIEVRSVNQILADNGYDGLVGAFRYLKPEDRLHLNDAQPICRDTGMLKTGDIAFSMRNPSTVAIYRPSENRITALRFGPWLLQHDINLLPDGRFSVFNNFLINQKHLKRSGPVSTVMIWDPLGNTVSSPYETIAGKADIHTDGSGRCRILPNGDVFIEESERHRLLRVSADNIRWEYVNAPENQPDISGALHWSRYYLPGEISLDWKKEP